MAAAEPPGAAHLAQLAENRLYELQENFQALTEKITLRMEEMGERIENLEKHVSELMAEAGIESTAQGCRPSDVAYSTPCQHPCPEQ
ncbi:heat shock factor-binding protein 1-like protein 1 [Nothoprocta perdicaria]|uniref:heat shock factor-binding protein 1-like protein 1 n=1 Tax=Nothoprocta perdicaria TaxID=30464 RepID=UPI000E1BC62A|nr:heat shock factor-binding protein 1-like protein 1 [Nothoprocta perdicaria]XP_025890697.1 heat shock factor-binding protein 1-like protein 1 [Nothoprocta perdicaria]